MVDLQHHLTPTKNKKEKNPYFPIPYLILPVDMDPKTIETGLMKYIFLFIIVLHALNPGIAYGQSNKVQGFKETKVSKGFMFGYLNTKFGIKENRWRQTNYADSLNSITSSGNSGFSLGLLLEFDLNKYFSFRTRFQLSFSENDLIYDQKTKVEKLKNELVSLDIPLHFILQPGKGKTTPYALFGPAIKFNFASPEPEKNKLQPKKFDIEGDVGIGVEFKFLKNGFILAPEFFYSKGLMNLKGNVSNLYNNVLSSYKSQEFCFLINIRSIAVEK